MQIKEILRLTPRKRQTMLFSATMTEEVRSLAALSLQHPVRLAANVKATAPRQLKQEIVRIKVRIVATVVAFRGLHNRAPTTVAVVTI